MHSLTKNVGNSAKVSGNPFDHSKKVRRILVTRPNHRLGNLLLITPLIQEIEALFPECKVDLFIKGGLGPVIFKNYSNIGKIIQLPKKHFKAIGSYLGGWLSLKRNQYDIVINVEKGSSSGRLSAQFANSRHYFFGDADESSVDDKHIARYPVYNLRNYLSKIGLNCPNTNIPPLDLKLDDAEKASGKVLLSNIVKNDKSTISIFTFATGSKCYSEDWWADIYQKLVADFPDFNVVEILPVENVSQIAFQAPTFYSKDVREIAAVIANTEVFIGADSGIMHLASSALTPTIGLFTVSNASKYGPYGNQSVAIDTNMPDYKDSIFSNIHKILKQSSDD
jgi:ADP-heptose:LPS heptosyltransferase